MMAPFPSHNPPMTPSWSQLRCAMLGMLGLCWAILGYTGYAVGSSGTSQASPAVGGYPEWARRVD